MPTLSCYLGACGLAIKSCGWSFQRRLIGEQERANLMVMRTYVRSYVVRRVSAHARLRYNARVLDHQSRGRERERRARETPEQREARLSQHRLRNRERARERLAAEHD